MLRVGLCVFVALFAAPRSAAAQCVLEGMANVTDVTPPGASVRFGVAEQARVSLEGTHAVVTGITPVAFVGRARARDVSVYVTEATEVRGVLRIAPDSLVRVARAREAGVVGSVEAGPTRVHVSLPCGALSLAEPEERAETEGSTEPEAQVERSVSRLVRLRGPVLRAYATAQGGSSVTLRLRSGFTRDDWPDLEVVGSRGRRLHVLAGLGPDVQLDGWVERDEVGLADGEVSGCGCDVSSDGSACGHGYGNMTYGGPAVVRAGTELRDPEGHVWGRVVIETTVVVAVISVVGRWRDASGETGTTRTDTVWVESLPGLVADPCGGLAAQLDREAVTLPTDD